jgi:hypothetical protein
MRDWIAEYNRALRDLDFELSEVTAIANDTSASQEDRQWARDMRDIYIP